MRIVDWKYRWELRHSQLGLHQSYEDYQRTEVIRRMIESMLGARFTPIPVGKGGRVVYPRINSIGGTDNVNH